MTYIWIIRNKITHIQHKNISHVFDYAIVMIFCFVNYKNTNLFLRLTLLVQSLNLFVREAILWQYALQTRFGLNIKPWVHNANTWRCVFWTKMKTQAEICLLPNRLIRVRLINGKSITEYMKLYASDLLGMGNIMVLYHTMFNLQLQGVSFLVNINYM